MPSAIRVLTTRWMPSAAAMRSVPSGSAIASTARSAAAGSSRRPAAEEVAGVEVAEHEVRVGHGGGGPAPAVAGGSGLGARALGPDLEDPARHRPRRWTRRPRRGVTMSRLGRATRWPATPRSAASWASPCYDQRDVGAGPAHVEGDQVPLAEEARAVAAARHAAGRARQDGARRDAHRLADRRHAPVGLHDQHRAGVAGGAQALGQAREVARQGGAHVGVDDGGGDPLVLLDLRAAPPRRARRTPRAAPGAAPAPSPRSCARVAIGVEVADRDRLDAARRRAAMARSSERASSGVATRPSARSRSRTPSRRARGHEGDRRRHAEVVAVVLQPLAHLDHVAVALGGQEPDARALALEERVGRDGGAVHDALGLARAARRRRVPRASARA